MDTNERLRHLLEERGWSEYRLAKSCGLNQSTIANIYRRNTVPSIATLESICQGFGITLSQFFSEGEMVELTPELKELFEYWVALAPNQKSAVLQVVKAMNPENKIKKWKRHKVQEKFPVPCAFILFEFLLQIAEKFRMKEFFNRNS